jgi:hypothetical protein
MRVLGGFQAHTLSPCTWPMHRRFMRLSGPLLSTYKTLLVGNYGTLLCRYIVLLVIEMRWRMDGVEI